MATELMLTARLEAAVVAATTTAATAMGTVVVAVAMVGTEEGTAQDDVKPRSLLPAYQTTAAQVA